MWNRSYKRNIQELEAEKIQKGIEESEAAVTQLARQDINAFCEYVGKDNTGQQLIQDKIHEEIQWHINECRSLGLKNCGILAPWGHGKTEQIIFRVLDEIGKNPNVRIQVICNTDDNATARVSSIAKYIESDDEYHKVYPDAIPAKGEEWGKHKIIVSRESKSKDGTVESWGITSSGTGSRADISIFDDPVDLRNAILNPSMRQQVKTSFKNVWLPRLMPDGFRIYIATMWHEDDLTSELLKNPEWNFLVMAISDDYERIECESKLKGKYTIPLWRLWTPETLKKQFATIGSTAFDRGYRQKPINDEDRLFKSSDRIFRRDLNVNMIPREWPKFIGCDPFGKNVVITTLAISPNFTRWVKKIIRLKSSPKQTVYALIDEFYDSGAQFIVCENNAAQSAIVQWIEEVGGKNIPIVPFSTGANKNQMLHGLPSLEVEFSNGSWIVPMDGVDESDYGHPLVVFKNELKSYPVSETFDTIMSAWFAREGARFYIDFMEKSKKETQVDQSEVLNVQQVKIGEY